MTPSIDLARVVCDELARLGVRDVVLCPGSRSAPFAYAAQEADRAGRLRLHVRIDERSAAFLALGLATVEGIPAVVITTSGTACANLHPAVLEAHHAGVPLLVLTADRPPELRGTGANQTTQQIGLYGAAVRWSHDLGVPEGRAGEQASWRTVVDRAYAAAVGSLSGDPGPVHLNVPLRDPLVPELGDGASTIDSGVTTDPGPTNDTGSTIDPGRADGAPWTQLPATVVPRIRVPQIMSGGAGGPEHAGADAIEDEPRTLVVLGDLPNPAAAQQACAIAAARAWPVLSEPFGYRSRGVQLPHGAALAEAPDLNPALRPEQILVLGRPTLSRAVARLLAIPGARIELVAAGPRWADPGHRAHRVHPWSALHQLAQLPARSDSTWWRDWQAAADRAHEAVTTVVAGSWPSGPAVASLLLDCLPPDARLFVGSSNPVRDLDLARHDDAGLVLANRGLAGIDGVVSTAVGMALAHPGGPNYALLGDLTFLHDINGLLIGPGEPRPDLTIVVVNDDGGGIFTLLEYGEPERADSFERVFATPTGRDLGEMARAYGAEFVRVDRARQLRQVLGSPAKGIRVVEVRIDRSTHRDLHTELRQAVHTAIVG